MLYVVVCGLSGSAVFLPHLINGTIFEKKLFNINCVFWYSLQLLSETFLVLGRIQPDVMINIHRCSLKVSLIFVRFLIILAFSRQIFEKYSNMKFTENRCGCSIRADARTDMTKLIVAFNVFAKAPKNNKPQCSRRRACCSFRCYWYIRQRASTFTVIWFESCVQNMHICCSSYWWITWKICLA
jgi:hypothetical protein